MTVQNTTLRKAGPSQGNGSNTSFPFTFKVFSTTDVLVTYLSATGVESSLVLTTDYTVSLNADQNTSPGGTVTMLWTPATGTYITLTSQVPNTQTLALTNSGGFYPTSINDALDRSVIEIQQLAENLSRSLKVPISSPVTANPLLPIPSPHQLIGWDAYGTGLKNYDPTNSSSIVYVPQGTGSLSSTVQDKLHETVSVKDFGAKGDGVTDDTASIQAALNSGKSVFFPNGTYLTGMQTFPSNIRVFGESLGATFIKANGTISSNTLFYLTSVTNVEICNFTFMASATSHPSLTWIVANSSSNISVHDIYINTCNTGVTTNNTTKSNFERITVNLPTTRGFYIGGSSSSAITTINCTVIGAGIDHCIQYVGGSAHVVKNCNVSNATAFGINFWNVINSTMDGNTCVNTTREGINIQDSNNCFLINNNITWTTGGISTDFGMSVWGVLATGGNANFNVVSGNYINGCAKSGIALAEKVQFNTVSHNTIQNGNTLNEALGSGVLIYGGVGSGSSNNSIINNTVYESAGKMKYGVNDTTSAGGNYIGNNHIYGVATSFIGKLSTSFESLNKTGYTAYTPTVTALSGTITTASATGNYYEIGGMVFFNVRATITTNGTGGGAVLITLPYTNGGVSSTVSGRENALTGVELIGSIGAAGTTVQARNYGNAYPGGDGAVIELTGFYQRA